MSRAATGMRRVAAAAAAGVVLALVAPAPPAQAASCEEGGGVTVVVDFAGLGGGVPVRCAAGDPTSGLDALVDAGFTPTRAAQQPGYFVCRIDDKPASDPCQRTSPSDAYWSYWHGTPGGGWSYRNSGPAESDPRPGQVEGWAFGAGAPPSVPPPAASAKPAPPPAADPPPAAGTAPTTPETGSSAPRGAASRQPAAPATPPAVSTAPADPALAAPVSPTGAPVTPSATTSPAEARDDGRPTGDDLEAGRVATRTDDGSPAGAIAAGGLVALLAAGGWHAWRRRRLDETA